MSKFNKYATKLDIIARAAFSQFEKAEKREREAQDRMKKYPQRGGIVSPEYQAEQAKATAEYYDSKMAMNKIKQNVPPQAMKEAQELRSELEKAVFDTFSPKPSAVDMQTMELLKCDVLKDREYLHLVNSAINSENYTMARIIGQFAEQKASTLPHEDSIVLRQTASIGKQDFGAVYLQSFDNMIDIMNRCLNNSGIMDRWGEFTRDSVEGF